MANHQHFYGGIGWAIMHFLRSLLASGIVYATHLDAFTECHT
jgi:hypothetical protein